MACDIRVSFIYLSSYIIYNAFHPLHLLFRYPWYTARLINVENLGSLEARYPCRLDNSQAYCYPEYQDLEVDPAGYQRVARRSIVPDVALPGHTLSSQQPPGDHILRSVSFF